MNDLRARALKAHDMAEQERMEKEVKRRETEKDFCMLEVINRFGVNEGLQYQWVMDGDKERVKIIVRDPDGELEFLCLYSPGNNQVAVCLLPTYDMMQFTNPDECSREDFNPIKYRSGHVVNLAHLGRLLLDFEPAR